MFPVERDDADLRQIIRKGHVSMRGVPFFIDPRFENRARNTWRTFPPSPFGVTDGQEETRRNRASDGFQANQNRDTDGSDPSIHRLYPAE